MSAAELREAAATMRERAKVASSGPWEFRPRRGFQTVSNNPATIGFNDTAGYFVMLREGTWATENNMRYVASWHPAVALAVADLLDSAALHVEYTGDLVSEDIKHALTVARAYLGRSS